jgi:hypothetical protein
MSEEYADGIFDLMEDYDHLMSEDEALEYTEREINRRLCDPKDALCMVSAENISEAFSELYAGDLAGLSAAMQSGDEKLIGKELIAALRGYFEPIVREAVEYEVSCMEIKE